MTAREASRWAERRKQGRLPYALRSGLASTAGIFAANLLLQLLVRADRPGPVPWTILAAAVVPCAAVCVLLEYFRWNYRELQFFLFNKAQACSDRPSRA